MEQPAPTVVLAGVAMVFVGLASVVAWRTRTRAGWRFFGMGALAWAVSVASKIVWAVPTNRYILGALKRLLGDAAGAYAGWLYLGLLTGIFECGIGWLFVRKTRLRNATQQEAVAFGIAFGAVEAVLLGIVTIVSTVAALFFWKELPDAAKESLASTRGWLRLSLPAFERAYTLVAHLLSCLLIVRGVQSRKSYWFWTAFTFKSLLDAMAAWGIDRFGVKTDAGYLKLELVLLAFVVAAALSLGWMLRRSRIPSQEAARGSA